MLERKWPFDPHDPNDPLNNIGIVLNGGPDLYNEIKAALMLGMPVFVRKARVEESDEKLYEAGVDS